MTSMPNGASGEGGNDHGETPSASSTPVTAPGSVTTSNATRTTEYSENQNQKNGKRARNEYENDDTSSLQQYPQQHPQQQQQQQPIPPSQQLVGSSAGTNAVSSDSSYGSSPSPAAVSAAATAAQATAISSSLHKVARLDGHNFHHHQRQQHQEQQQYGHHGQQIIQPQPQPPSLSSRGSINNAVNQQQQQQQQHTTTTTRNQPFHHNTPQHIMNQNNNIHNSIETGMAVLTPPLAAALTGSPAMPFIPMMDNTNGHSNNNTSMISHNNNSNAATSSFSMGNMNSVPAPSGSSSDSGGNTSLLIQPLHLHNPQQQQSQVPPPQHHLQQFQFASSMNPTPLAAAAAAAVSVPGGEVGVVAPSSVGGGGVDDGMNNNNNNNHQQPNNNTGGVVKMLRPFPYFYYRDFSHIPDPDPLSPLTAPGRVPNFPAKMHSILSRSDLSEIVSWNEHGRAWRVLKPREFEVKVIPTYFEHAKFSSFIRQANGWGFRRITQGKDRNSYYHEMFLRGLPHLCKMMKRPGVAEKQAADPDQEPDFYLISAEHPVPERAEDESILLQCTLQGGPKARMPIYFGALTTGLAGESTQPGPTLQNDNPRAIPLNESVSSIQPRAFKSVGPSSLNLVGDNSISAISGNGQSLIPIPTLVHPAASSNNTNDKNTSLTVQSQQHTDLNQNQPQNQRQYHGNGTAAVLDPGQSLTLPPNPDPAYAAGFAAAQKQMQALFGISLPSIAVNSQAVMGDPRNLPVGANNGASLRNISPAQVIHHPGQSQQQHFAPLLPRPHTNQNAYPQVIVHQLLPQQQQVQTAGAQPLIHPVAFQPMSQSPAQPPQQQTQSTTDGSQQYRPQHHDVYHLQPLSVGQVSSNDPSSSSALQSFSAVHSVGRSTNHSNINSGPVASVAPVPASSQQLHQSATIQVPNS